MNNSQPSAQSGEVLSYLDDTNDHLMFSREHWNKIIAILRGVLATREWTITENGILTEPAGGGTGDVDIGGQWDPTVKYATKVIVFFTPDGDFGRTFYSLQEVPAGIAPDTGFPFWRSFPLSPASVWA